MARNGGCDERVYPCACAHVGVCVSSLPMILFSATMLFIHHCGACSDPVAPPSPVKELSTPFNI